MHAPKIIRFLKSIGETYNLRGVPEIPRKFPGNLFLPQPVAFFPPLYFLPRAVAKSHRGWDKPGKRQSSFLCSSRKSPLSQAGRVMGRTLVYKFLSV